jgi:cation diffusion facilitator family transporter
MNARAHFAMRLSLLTSFVLLVAKVSAYVLTESTGVLGDAAESVIHVVVIMFSAYSLSLVSKPADQDHLYGHGKVQFFSAGIEGVMIIIAAVFIAYEAVWHWIKGSGPQHIGLGLALIAATVLINGALGGYLIAQGRKLDSLILRANGQHVLTDCWTSVGVLAGLGLTALTGWKGWDPLTGLIMAANIMYAGYGLITESVSGLMDVAEPAFAQWLNEAFRDETTKHGLTFHELRHRDIGGAEWVDVHLLFPHDLSLREAHRIATQIEDALRQRSRKPLTITTHLECADDHEDQHDTRPHA